MKKSGLLKFEDLYKQQCLMLTHDCINNNAPNEIRQFVKKDQEVSRFNLRAHTQEPLNLRIPIYKTRAGKNSFRSKGPNFWNEIPSETKTSPTRQRCVLTVSLRVMTLALDLDGQTDDDIVSKRLLKYPND